MVLAVKSGFLNFTLGNANVVARPGSIGKDTWFHVAVVVSVTYNQDHVSGHEIFLYKDGILSGKGFNTEMPTESYTITVAGMVHGNPLCGSITELRVWSEPLSAAHVANRRMLSIPVVDTSYPTLRLSWMPLRNGGPKSYFLWQMTTSQLYPGLIPGKVPLGSTGKPLYTVPIALLAPKPTLLWDRLNGCDTGVNTIFSMPPTLPPTWSAHLLYAIDDWTDGYDRAFVPEYLWPSTTSPQLPANVEPGEIWIPRVIKFPYPEYASTFLGTTASLGLENAGGGGVGFTLETWIRYIPKVPIVGKASANTMIVQNLLGNEDADSNVRTGFLGTGKANALRIGLVDGRPYISVHGDLKGLNDALVIAPYSLLPLRWVHVAYACAPRGSWRILVNGMVVAESKPNAPFVLKASGALPIHAFGWAGKTELTSEICEMRLWSVDLPNEVIRMGLDKSRILPRERLTVREGLRLAWLPLTSYKLLFYDLEDSTFRGFWNIASVTRRPYLLPPAFSQCVKTLPTPHVVDDTGDAFESCYVPNLVQIAYSNLIQSERPIAIPGVHSLGYNQPSSAPIPPSACAPYQGSVGYSGPSSSTFVPFRADFETRLEYDEWDVNKTGDYSGGLRDGSMIVMTRGVYRAGGGRAGGGRAVHPVRMNARHIGFGHNNHHYENRDNTYGYADDGDGDGDAGGAVQGTSVGGGDGGTGDGGAGDWGGGDGWGGDGGGGGGDGGFSYGGGGDGGGGGG
eukprot:gene1607-1868_t